jgi:hypothetical protein
MKKVLFAAIFGICITATAIASPEKPSVNDKVLKAFHVTFVSAHDVSWSEFQNVFEARFTFNDIITRVIYDSEGAVIKTIRYYYEQQLPLTVLTKVKRTFEDLKIKSVTEVSAGERTEYHIVLEDSKNLTMVLADNAGNLTTEHKFTKG